MVKRLPLIIFFIISILFITGVYQIFIYRFKVGDIYPPYSSLRSDPLGARVFYEGISMLPEHTVERNHYLTPRWKGDNSTTLFILGLSRYSLENTDEASYRRVSEILSSGTRVVISLNPPSNSFVPLNSGNTAPGEKDEDTSKEKVKSKEEHGDEKNKYSLFDTWGVDILRMKTENDFIANLSKALNAADLPSSIKFPSAFYFTDPDNEWTVHYSLNGLPVIISREFNGGTIILCADSYIFSNEAMVYNRYSKLLSWFAGSSRRIYFDESHFGIQKRTGIIDLAFKYRLQGVICVFFLVAVLYIWKNAVHISPVHESSGRNEKAVRSDKNHLDGLISLLERNIKPEDLIRICIKEWGASTLTYGTHQSGFISPKELEAATAEYSPKDPSRAYNSIYNKMMERKRL